MRTRVFSESLVYSVRLDGHDSEIFETLEIRISPQFQIYQSSEFLLLSYDEDEVSVLGVLSLNPLNPLDIIAHVVSESVPAPWLNLLWDLRATPEILYVRYHDYL